MAAAGCKVATASSEDDDSGGAPPPQDPREEVPTNGSEQSGGGGMIRTPRALGDLLTAHSGRGGIEAASSPATTSLIL